jgi:hypothetical protein
LATERSKARGVNGARNGAAIPYRYRGGSFERPAFFTPETALARKVGRGDYRDTSTYIMGMIAGCMAYRLTGQGFPGAEQLCDQERIADA